MEINDFLHIFKDSISRDISERRIVVGILNWNLLEHAKIL